MADLLYNYGLDEWRDWTTTTHTFLALADSYVPDKAHRYITDVAGDEITASGYHRSDVTTPTRTVDTALDRITYDCDDPELGSPVAGQVVAYVALARVGSGDADSLLLALFDVTNFATDSGQIVPPIANRGVHFIDQGYSEAP